MNLEGQLPQTRSIEELQKLIATIPYARFLGFSMIRDGINVIGRMDFSPGRLGNVRIQALHGGTLGALMELTAVCQLLTLSEIVRVPKTVNITVEYLRSAQAVDTFARATVTRHGRRVANVQVVAYQDDVAKPVAAANAHFLLAV
jgi:uncharacterized protein (TIGR00369 family)